VGTENKNSLNFSQTLKRALSPPPPHIRLCLYTDKNSMMGYFYYVKLCDFFFGSISEDECGKRWCEKHFTKPLLRVFGTC